MSTALTGALGPTYVGELVDASPEENLEDDPLSTDTSSKELVKALAEEELEWIGKTSTLGFGGLEAERILPSRVPSAKSLSGDLIRGVDFVLAIFRTWKSFIKSAIVISHGYETSTSRLRILGVEQYLQLDHEGVQGSESF